MKKIVYILSFLVVFLTSCETNSKFLEEKPNGKLFPDNFYNNETELRMANNTLFNFFRSAIERPYESMEIKYASSDDILGTGNQRECYNEVEINLETTANIDNDIQAGWERCYNTINTANSIILNYHRAAENVNEETLNLFVAQARFIRAFTYFWLVKFFNNVPLIETAFEADADREVRCAKAEDVYNLIVEDLEFAEKWLPVSWNDYDAIMSLGGATTKGAAKATLAKVYLQMAGFPVNGGNTYYAKARDKAKEIIDDAGIYGYALREHFDQVWDPYWKAYQSATDEVILWFQPSLQDYTVRAPNPSQPIELSGWESMVAEKYFYEHFPEGERKDFTFVTDIYLDAQHHLTYDQLSCKHPLYRKMWADDLTDGWEWSKRNDPTSLWLTDMGAKATWYSTRPVIVMRYADILLTYAEAKARTDGPDALAYQCLNDVRNRAYKGLGTTEASVSGLSTEAFIDAVVWERAYEFAGFEHTARWFDLQRLELVEKATTEWRDETEDKYRLRRPYTKKDYFLPIPNAELILNPNLANNNAEFE